MRIKAFLHRVEALKSRQEHSEGRIQAPRQISIRKHEHILLAYFDPETAIEEFGAIS